MSRLTKKEITVSAKKLGIDPVVYLDGTRAGRNRLELAIRHRKRCSGGARTRRDRPERGARILTPI
jgi:hypothetical protein